MTDVEQIVRLSARSDLQKGLEVAKADLARFQNDFNRSFGLPLTDIPKKFGNEMVKQANTIKGKYAEVRNLIATIVGVDVGVQAIGQGLHLAFREISEAIKESIRQSKEYEKSLNGIQIRLSLLGQGNASGVFKKLAEDLVKASNLTKDIAFNLSKEEAGGAAGLTQALGLDPQKAREFADAAKIITDNFGGNFLKNFQTIGLAIRGDEQALKDLGEALKGVSITTSDEAAKALKNIVQVAKLREEIKVIEASARPLLGLFASEEAARVAKEIAPLQARIAEIEKESGLESTDKAKEKAKAIEDQARAWKLMGEHIKDAALETRKMYEEQEKDFQLQTQHFKRSGFDPEEARRRGFGSDDQQGRQAFMDASEEAARALSTYSLVRQGIDFAGDAATNLGRAMAQGGRQFKEAAKSMIADVAGLIAKFATLAFVRRLALGVFGGGGGADVDTSAFGNGELIPRRGGGYIGHRFASGTPYSGVTSGETYLVGDNTNGREAVIPLPDGRNVPVKMAGGGRGTTINNVTIQAIDMDSFRSHLARHRYDQADMLLSVLDEKPSVRMAIRGT